MSIKQETEEEIIKVVTGLESLLEEVLKHNVTRWDYKLELHNRIDALVNAAERRILNGLMDARNKED